MTTRFTDELMEQGLTYKVLTLVSQIDVNNEFEKLQRERGLGSEKHRKEVSVQCISSRCLCQILKAEESRQLELSSDTCVGKLEHGEVWSVHETDLRLFQPLCSHCVPC